MDEDHICFKRRKRSYSTDKILEYSDTDSDDNLFDPTTRTNSINFQGINIQQHTFNKDENDLVDLLNNINKLNIDSNKDLFTKIIKKINDLEKKVETLLMVNIKIDTLKKDIDKILVEKDYVIENLKYEIYDLKDQLRESNRNIDSINHKSINSYYS